MGLMRVQEMPLRPDFWPPEQAELDRAQRIHRMVGSIQRARIPENIRDLEDQISQLERRVQQGFWKKYGLAICSGFVITIFFFNGVLAALSFMKMVAKWTAR